MLILEHTHFCVHLHKNIFNDRVLSSTKFKLEDLDRDRGGGMGENPYPN